MLKLESIAGNGNQGNELGLDESLTRLIFFFLLCLLSSSAGRLPRLGKLQMSV